MSLLSPADADRPAAGSGPRVTHPVEELWPGLLVVGVILNGVISLCGVLCFRQIGGHSLGLTVLLLGTTGVFLAVWASHHALLAVVRAEPVGGDSESGSGLPGLLKLLRWHWRGPGAGTPAEGVHDTQRRFLDAYMAVTTYVVVAANMCLEGRTTWPRIAPLVDGWLALSSIILISSYLSVGWADVRRAGLTTCRALASDESEGAPLTAAAVVCALLLAALALSAAYGVNSVEPFATANGLTFVPCHFGLTLLPLLLLSYCVLTLLAYALKPEPAGAAG